MNKSLRGSHSSQRWGQPWNQSHLPVNSTEQLYRPKWVMGSWAPISQEANSGSSPACVPTEWNLNMQVIKAVNCVIFRHLITITNTEKLGAFSCCIQRPGPKSHSPWHVPSRVSLTLSCWVCVLTCLTQAISGRGWPKDSGCSLLKSRVHSYSKVL